jgi:hypothetical protein
MYEVNMFFVRRPFVIFLLVGMLLTSCGGQPAAGEPTADVNATIAAGAQTLVASVFQTQTASAPTATNTSIPTETVTAGPSSTPLALPSAFASATQGVIFFASATPTGTFYTATPNPNTLSYGCNNLLLIESYTEPAGPFRPGQAFTQKWKVANTGTCDWLYLYHLVHVSGERLGGNGGRLSNKIEPGKWTTLSVDLDAPNAAGTYTGNWRFAHADGTPFGSLLPVSIRVERNPDPTKTPTSTNTPPTPANTPNLQQTLDALNTAVAGTAAAAATQTAIEATTTP